MNETDEVTSLTSLMAAAQCGHVEIAAKLITAGSNVNAVRKVRSTITSPFSLSPSLTSSPPPLQDTGWSALMLAAINNQKDVIKLLIIHGANKDHRDISKRTAFQLATVLGHRGASLALDGEKTGKRGSVCVSWRGGGGGGGGG